MDKYQKIRKKLIREGAIAAAVFAVLLGFALFILEQVATGENEQRQEMSTVRSLAQQISDLETKNGIASSSLIEFRRLKQRQSRGDFLIDREQARDIFDTLRKKYRISNLSMTVGPKEIMKDPALARPRKQVTFSLAKLEFDAMSDLHVFSFLQESAQSLPGFLKITDFRIQRQRKINSEVYVALSRGEEPRMVSVSVSFMWLGLEDKPKDGDAAQ